MSTAHDKGMAVIEELWGHDASRLEDLDPELHEYTIENCFGTVWSRPGLSIRDRELITLTVLMTVRGEGMRNHLRNVAHVGITEREVRELILHVMCYAGWPVGPFAMKIYKEVLAETQSEPTDT